MGSGDHMRKVVGAALGGMLLAGCQTEYRYEPFLANAENFEVANAKCQMMSTSAERQVVAWGSPMYVTAAQAANSMENVGRVDRFLQHCMTAQGWRRVAVETPVKQKPAAAAGSAVTPEMREKAILLLSIEHFVRPCGIRLTAKARADLRDLRDASPADVRQEGDALGARVFRQRVQEVGRKKACETTTEILKQQGMV